MKHFNKGFIGEVAVIVLGLAMMVASGVAYLASRQVANLPVTQTPIQFGSSFTPVQLSHALADSLSAYR